MTPLPATQQQPVTAGRTAAGSSDLNAPPGGPRDTRARLLFPVAAAKTMTSESRPQRGQCGSRGEVSARMQKRKSSRVSRKPGLRRKGVGRRTPGPHLLWTDF